MSPIIDSESNIRALNEKLRRRQDQTNQNIQKFGGQTVSPQNLFSLWEQIDEQSRTQVVIDREERTARGWTVQWQSRSCLLYTSDAADE